MKKLFIVASIIGFLTSSLAMAKTEGNYVGVDLLNTTYESMGTDSNNGKGGGKYHASDIGYGINYKYAFNFNNFFVAPGVFLDRNKVSAKFQDDQLESNRDKLRYSYGVKLNLGYDVTDEAAIFAVLGYGESKMKWSNSLDSTNFKSESIIYGLGAKYSVTQNIDVNFGYETSKYQADGSPNFDIDVTRLGVSYKF